MKKEKEKEGGKKRRGLFLISREVFKRVSCHGVSLNCCARRLRDTKDKFLHKGHCETSRVISGIYRDTMLLQKSRRRIHRVARMLSISRGARALDALWSVRLKFNIAKTRRRYYDISKFIIPGA